MGGVLTSVISASKPTNYDFRCEIRLQSLIYFAIKEMLGGVVLRVFRDHSHEFCLFFAPIANGR